MAMNLAGIADWEPGFPFINLMWGARMWMTRNQTPGGPWNTEQIAHCEFDENGYPLEVPFSAPDQQDFQEVFTLIPNRVPPGEYVILFEGEGEFGGVMGTRIIEQGKGRATIELTGGKDTVQGIAIKSSAKGNHLRNIRIVARQYESADLAADPFLPEFLQFCEPFHALRFMDWATTNNSYEREWANRKKPTFYTMVGAGGDYFGIFGKPASHTDRMLSGGVAIEVMLDLCNRLKKDAWLCVPHLATDEYIREYAKLVKAKLNPSLKVYLEYSNEVWNWQFQQAQWMIRDRYAGETIEAKGFNPWGGKTPEFTLGDGTVASEGGSDHPERIGALFRRCFAIWEEVFDGPDRARLVRVAASQAGWLDVAKRTLKYTMENGGCDAFSVTGYFGPNDAIYEKWESSGASLTADDVIADMDQIITSAESDVETLSGAAREYGVRFIVYEGGQHIQPKGQNETAYMPALKDAQTHPKIYDLYMKNFAMLARHGCDLFAVFASVSEQGSRWGSWGHIEYYGQPLEEAPKMRAVLDANTPVR